MRLAAPPSPGGVRHVGTCHAWHEKQKQTQRRQHHEQHSHHHRSIDQQQPKTAKEVIAANVQSLIEQLEAGHSDALTAYLNAMSRFHNYSLGNILEIARQTPDATSVAGFWKWKELGRSVKKGEKGIRILAPIVGVRRKKDEEADKDITKQNTARIGWVPFGVCLRCVADRRRGASRDAGDLRRRRREPRQADCLHRASGHRACLYRAHRARAWHELRRTHRHPARTVEGRRVQHLSA